METPLPVAACPNGGDDDGLPQYLLVKKGKRLTVTRRRYHAPPVHIPPRGDIVEFSSRARRRMLRRVAEIDWRAAGDGLFITYTYPDSHIDVQLSERKQHRGVIHRDVESYCGRNVGAIWKVEWMPRLTGAAVGRIAPHLHVLYFGVRYVSYDFLRERWASAIGATGYVNVHGEQLDAGNMCSVYMAKYCAKESPSFRLDNVPYRNKTGRHYGWRRKEEIPWHDTQAFALPSKEVFDLLMRRACEILPYLKGYYGDGFTLLGKDAEKVFEEFRANVLDTGCESV